MNNLTVQKVEQSISYDQKRIELIKNTVCKGASNEELELFLHTCKRTGLDPIAKQIYSVPRGNTRTIQVGIDGLRLIADRTGRYIPGREATYTYDKNGNIESATAYVKKLACDGSWHEVSCTAFFSEFNAKQGLWSKMPRVMLAKCAEAQCLRKCFPGEMSGVYAEDEMHQADVKPIDMPVVEEKPKLTDEQATEIKSMIFETDEEYHDQFMKRIKSLYNADDFNQIPSDAYGRIKIAVQKKIEDLRKAEQVEVVS